MAEFDEAAIVRAARAGERTAFERLYARYRPAVRAVVLAHAPWSEVEDLTQDVFMSAWHKLPQLRTPAKFGGWLMQCARNRCVDHHRRNRPRGPMPERGAPMPPRAEVREVLEAIGSLSASYRETLLMRLVEGMSGPEIAARTGLTPRSVRVNLHRGFKQLRAKLEPEADTAASPHRQRGGNT